MLSVPPSHSVYLNTQTFEDLSYFITSLSYELNHIWRYIYFWLLKITFAIWYLLHIYSITYAIYCNSLVYCYYLKSTLKQEYTHVWIATKINVILHTYMQAHVLNKKKQS